jgi:hypothetical protein
MQKRLAARLPEGLMGYVYIRILDYITWHPNKRYPVGSFKIKKYAEGPAL